VPDHFRFSVKMPKAITHEAKLNCSTADLSIFLEQVSLLSEKLGPILIQLPPSLQFLPSNVESFLSLLRGQYLGEIVWEPRHFSWFDGEAKPPRISVALIPQDWLRREIAGGQQKAASV
jgi:uncharacterized protein YecE (DUF72 family)